MLHQLARLVRRAGPLLIPCAAALGQCATQWLTTGGVAGVATRGPSGGTIETIRAATTWDPDGPGPMTPRLAVVGSFEVAGTAVSPSVAAWDPATGTWSVIGPANFDLGGSLHSVAALPNGDLVVGGFFQTINGVPMSCIARWNGSAWSPLGAGLDQTPYVLLTMPNGDLIAGGFFLASGTTALDKIGRWNGTTWSALGTGMASSTARCEVNALAALPNGDLVAGGTFTSAGGVPALNIARWNGSAWATLGAGIPPAVTFTVVSCLATAPNGDLFVGGNFRTSSGAPADFLARWNGSTWSPVGSGPNNVVRSLCVAANGDLFAGGFFLSAGGQPAARIARWNGAQWAPLGSGITPSTPNSTVLALVPLPNGEIVAAGQFVAAGGVPLNHVARWNGTDWAPLSEGTDSRITASTTAANGDLVVAGAFTRIGGTPATRIAQRVGSTWIPLGSGLAAPARALARLPNGDLVAAGGVTVNRLARWNGSSWSSMGSGIAAGDTAYALAVMPNGDLIVGGSFSVIDGVPANNIARWNGTAWAPVGTGVVGYIRSLAVLANGDLIAGGGFSTAGGVTANNIARWNGTAWSALGSGVAAFFIPSVTALLPLPNGQLIAGGRFQTAGGITTNGIARWTGTNWATLGTGINPLPGTSFSWDVLALSLLPNGDVVAGGVFVSAGGVPVNNVARWNGSTWSAFGTGCNSFVDTITPLPNGDLAIAGSFLTVDNAVSAFLAQRTASCPAFATPSGSGCTGSAGYNTLKARTLPWLGSTCRAEVTGVPANAVVIGALGLGTLSLPLASLLPQGVAGCSLLVTPDALLQLVPSGGTASIDLSIPSAVALVGGTFHEQALPLEFGDGGLLALTSSNAVSLTIGVF